jgi:2,3-bisphosphoglycerate-dependent phosphoglycerate mutase
MANLILLRHGESEWNLQNRFTGWTDVSLSENGKKEAYSAGLKLKEQNLLPEIAHCSVLSRAIETLDIVLKTCERNWIPIKKTWRLNERHYGALQGLNKEQTKLKYGEKQLRLWRRSYETPPPSLNWDDPRHPRFDQRYTSLPKETLPSTESLKDVLERLLPYWQDFIYPDLLKYQTVLIVAHGNSLRALIKHLEAIGDNEISNFELATGKPRLYSFDSDLNLKDINQL